VSFDFWCLHLYDTIRRSSSDFVGKVLNAELLRLKTEK